MKKFREEIKKDIDRLPKDDLVKLRIFLDEITPNSKYKQNERKFFNRMIKGETC